MLGERETGVNGDERGAGLGAQRSAELSPLRQALRELYRLLPALAMGVAGLAIIITLAQALVVRGPASAARARASAIGPALAAVTKPSASAVPTVAGTAESGREGETASGLEAARASSRPQPTATAATPPAPAIAPPPTSSPEGSAQAATPTAPVATMDLTLVAPRRVRARGRISTPAASADYWFLIEEPGRTGVFRQGPAQLNAQGSFVFDLDLQPLNEGPDSVVLAAVPRDVSLAWTREALRSGSWLPVVDVQPEDGLLFLTEERL